MESFETLSHANAACWFFCDIYDDILKFSSTFWELSCSSASSSALALVAALLLLRYYYYTPCLVILRLIGRLAGCRGGKLLQKTRDRERVGVPPPAIILKQLLSRCYHYYGTLNFTRIGLYYTHSRFINHLFLALLTSSRKF